MSKRISRSRLLLALSMNFISNQLIAQETKVSDKSGSEDYSFSVDASSTILWEEALFGEEFDPKLVDNSTPWKLIDEQLNALGEKLPRTEAYLRSIFNHGRLLWYFVTDDNIRLSNTNVEAEDPRVAISYKKEQISLNDGHNVFIRKFLWEKLSNRGKAILLIHEMYWTAVGDEFVGTGKNIRDLSATTLNQSLSSISAQNLAKTLLLFLGHQSKNARIYKIISHELKYPRGQGIFVIEEFYSEEGPQILATINRGVMKGWQITMPNPNPDYPCTYFSDDTGEVFIDLGKEEEKNLFKVEAENFCSSLEYGGHQDWRLTSEDELYVLYRRFLINRLRYAPMDSVLRRRCQKSTLRETLTEQPVPYPKGLHLLSSENQVLELGDSFKEITDYYNDHISYICIRKASEDKND